MDKFFALDEKKQITIINAALQCFGKHGYEKASIADIAKSAGISKASVFQYFGTKKKLYEYLLHYTSGIIMKSFQQEDENVDLFERVLLASFAKMEILKENPYFSQFIAGAWSEGAKEVQDIVVALRAEAGRIQSSFILRKEDMEKFKRPEDAVAVSKILMLMAEGYALRFQNEATHSEYDSIMAEFQDMMEVMRRNFYKGEYL